MDAGQRSVFQGIVYYYRENMVNCRYQVTLKDAVDGALLQQALDAARAKAPYYFQKPVWEKKLLHLEPSDAPCPVRQGSAKPEFPDENGFTVALSYEGKAVYFDWFHFLADGRGMAPFMTMVLQFYCNLRYGTAFEGRTLETDPAYDIEDILAKYPESQVANDMQRPVVQTFEETPTCCRVRLEKAGLVDAALRCGVKPFSTLTALLCKAVQAYLDKDEVLYSYSTDARDALGAPNALYNCVASFQRKLPLTADAPLAEVAVGVDADLKENLSAERKLFRIAEQMGWVYRVYQHQHQKAHLPDGRVHQRLPGGLLGELSGRPLRPVQPGADPVHRGLPDLGAGRRRFHRSGMHQPAWHHHPLRQEQGAAPRLCRGSARRVRGRRHQGAGSRRAGRRQYIICVAKSEGLLDEEKFNA